MLISANAARRFGGDGDEVARADRHLLAVDDHHPRPSNHRVSVFGAVIAVVMADGLGVWRKLDLIEPESADPQLVPDAFVVFARGWMRPRSRRDLRRVEQTESHELSVLRRVGVWFLECAAGGGLRCANPPYDGGSL